VTSLQNAKTVVLGFLEALDRADPSALDAVISAATTQEYHWRGMYPIYEQKGAKAVAAEFYHPLRRAFSSMQRRAI